MPHSISWTILLEGVSEALAQEHEWRRSTCKPHIDCRPSIAWLNTLLLKLDALLRLARFLSFRRQTPKHATASISSNRLLLAIPTKILLRRPYVCPLHRKTKLGGTSVDSSIPMWNISENRILKRTQEAKLQIDSCTIMYIYSCRGVNLVWKLGVPCDQNRKKKFPFTRLSKLRSLHFNVTA